VHARCPTARPSTTLRIAESNNYNRSVEILVGVTKRRKPINFLPEVAACMENGKFVARRKTRLKSLARGGKTHRSGKTRNILLLHRE